MIGEEVDLLERRVGGDPYLRGVGAREKAHSSGEKNSWKHWMNHWMNGFDGLSHV